MRPSRKSLHVVLAFLTIWIGTVSADTECKDKFRCDSVSCIDHSKVCDGIKDCANGVDESKCRKRRKRDTCSTIDSFSCHDLKQCIHKSKVCDGNFDCTDQSDERHCSHDCRGFKCKDGKCLPLIDQCDGIQQCPDGSDEENCPNLTLDKSPNCTDNMKYFNCKDDTCLTSLDLVCDGKTDCASGEDETLELCKSSVICSECQHGCQTYANGASTCQCEKGYTIHSSGKRCLDINECNLNICSQYCENLIGSYSCSCADGYKLGADNHTCINEGPIVRIVYDYTIKVFLDYPDGASVLQKEIPQTGNVHTVLYDEITETVYWNDVFTVHSSKLKARATEKLFTITTVTHKEQMEFPALFEVSMDLDRATKNLFIGIGDRLIVCDTKIKTCATHSQIDEGVITSVAVDSKKGVVYSATSEGIVYQARTGRGYSRRIEIDNCTALDLKVDPYTGKVYVLCASGDPITLYVYQVIFQRSKLIQQVYSEEGVHLVKLRKSHIAINNDKIYITHRYGTGVVIHKYTGEVLEEIKNNGYYYFFGVDAVDIDNKCWDSRCSHICLPRFFSGYSCLCPEGMTTLPHNSYECVWEKNFEGVLATNGKELIMINTDTITGFNFEQILSMGAAKDEKHIEAAVYDAVDKTAYISYEGSLYKVNIAQRTAQKIVIKHSVGSVMTFDPVDRVIFFYDLHLKAIQAYSITRKTVSEIFHVGRNEPFSITLDYNSRELFWLSKGRTVNTSVVYHISLSKGESVQVEAPLLEEIHYDPWKDHVYMESVDTVYYLDSNYTTHSLRYFGGAIDMGWVILRKQHVALIGVGADEKFFVTMTHSGTAEDVTNDNEHIRLTIHKTDLDKYWRLLTRIGPLDNYLKSSCGNDTCAHGMCLTLTTDSHECYCSHGHKLSADLQSCDSVCDASNMKCNDDTCIPKDWLCDGDADCSDGEDEAACDRIICEDRFKCDNICISKTFVCDGVAQCRNATDEMNCPHGSCSADQFECSNKVCIPLSLKCDGKYDCIKGEDEHFCEKTPLCKLDEYQCHDKKTCLPAMFVCDGYQDCDQGDDESNSLCAKYKPEPKEVMFFECSSTGKKILEAYKCDGVKDCPHGEDEESCTTCKGYRCTDGTCIGSYQECDGIPQCPNEEDEVSCYSKCPGFACPEDGKCLAENKLCDGVNDCRGNADEQLPKCQEIIKAQKLLIAKEEESKYNMTHITEYCDGFKCKDGTCIREDQLCDNHEDCPGGDDEGHQCDNNTSCDNTKCDHHCHSSPHAAYCSCLPGYTLERDGKTCTDIDECLHMDTCSHYCFNDIGGHTCTCHPGYRLTSRGACRAEETNSSLIAIDQSSITVSHLGTHLPPHPLYSSKVTKFADVAYNSHEGAVYVTDQTQSRILKVSQDGTVTPVLPSAFHPGVLSVDYITGNVYFSDGFKHIQVCRQLSDYRHILCASIITANASIESIEVYPSENLMFVSLVEECKEHTSHGNIISTSLDGTNAHIVVATSRHPKSLTIDTVLRRIYWLDVGFATIESCRFNGEDRRVIATNAKYIQHISVFEDWIYMYNARTLLLEVIHRVTGEPVEALRQHVRGNFLIANRVLQPLIRNTCLEDPCQHICVPNMSSYKCLCGFGYELAPDGTSCIEIATEDIDPGKLLPEEFCVPGCKHGDCHWPDNGRTPYCVCQPGYTGAYCDIRENHKFQTEDNAQWIILIFLLTLLGSCVGIGCWGESVKRRRRADIAEATDGCGIIDPDELPF